MTMDLTTPQAMIAQHYMRETKGIRATPFDVEQLEGQPCWYFYYALPQGVLELEVFFDEGRDDWNVTVTSFPVSA
jgi:hypothetical protein